MISLRAMSPSITRITIEAALGAALHMGQGDERMVDQRAIEFSRAVLRQMEIDGVVISCEGPKDRAPAFFKREKVGTGRGPKVEFIIDPVDGTTPTSKGGKDVISALVCAPEGCLQVLPDDGYYFKVAAGPESKGKVTMDMSVEEIARTVSTAKKKALENLTVMILDRERHGEILKRLRRLGVRIILIPDGDIAAPVAACLPETGVDLLVGAGAGPEATIGASAVKCLGGTMLVKVWRDEKDHPHRIDRLRDEGVDVDRVYSEDDLARGNELVFAASGVTKGELLDGVKFTADGAMVHSLCARLPSGTVETSTTLMRFKGHPVYERLF
jgi:fructose-1,6-bisphosphatase II